MVRSCRSWTAVLVPFLATACYDIEVTNPNEPNRSGAFASGAAVEAHVAGAFRDWYTTETGHRTFPLALSAVSFQHSTPAVCDAPYAEIPRRAIENTQGSTCILSLATWEGFYGALTTVADGLAVLADRDDLRAELGDDRSARIHAFGRFVQGVAHGSLALMYDRAAVLDETTSRTGENPLLDYETVSEAALDYLDGAAQESQGATWPAIPAEWMSVEVTPGQLARLSRSFAARIRANVARTPGERASVDWARVLEDAGAGITEDWYVGDQQAWAVGGVTVANLPSRPSQAPYFIVGMADGSENYQRWLDLPLHERRPGPTGMNPDVEPVLIVTPDTRFPQGGTRAEQVANPGTAFVIPSPETTGVEPSTQLWTNPARGTWRWSLYRWTGAEAYVSGAQPRWPLLTRAELRLLRAEALIRTGNQGAAAVLVNESRTAHGLAPTDAAGSNPDCVPRLPHGACGDLMEMMKWEKRLETKWKGPFLASWYFDGRGWGDLHEGTFLQVPVPCSDLQLLDVECYTFGGSGESSSPGSAYQWPGEVPGSE